MKTVKSKHVRKVIQHDPGVNIVEHSYVKVEEVKKTETVKQEPTKAEEK